ncbi:sugar-transfer associated ATP-grasp domain-containing protein [Aliiruegeria lutimaris]|uniref:sugar-transfer associated ATP-grasp domain-containing protein n=1 Tax=Aliiruegeria lutimaris TaxID=571298 RepID=UPI00147A496B|nr:sugar-transfer associated ATP-grasp domain-containing protein [Aliiruegeria lutimaris]
MRIIDAWWLAIRYNVPPLEYFLHQLWRSERRARLDDYLYWHENGPALAGLNAVVGGDGELGPVANKQFFSEFCDGLDLPSPRSFGVWKKGDPVGENSLPRANLWLKPSCGSQGIGAERWRWKDGGYRRGALVLTPDAMAEHIAEHARQHSETLVQEVIKAWPSHAPIIGPSPLCARIVTGRRRNGDVDIIDAMAVWPREGSDITQGGHIAMIELHSGQIGPVYEASETCASRQLEGSQLPNWQEALDYVRKGHSELPHFIFLGWDIAFGDGGPVLLEANAGWGCFHFQAVPDHPIADTPFASIVEEYI